MLNNIVLKNSVAQRWAHFALLCGSVLAPAAEERKRCVPLRYLLLALAACLLASAPIARAENADSDPAQLSKTRSDLYLKATRMQVADFADDINQLAVQSETCRAQHGSKACGLPEKALSSDKIEDRYAYYVKQPRSYALVRDVGDIDARKSLE